MAPLLHAYKIWRSQSPFHQPCRGRRRCCDGLCSKSRRGASCHTGKSRRRTSCHTRRSRPGAWCRIRVRETSDPGGQTLAVGGRGEVHQQAMETAGGSATERKPTRPAEKPGHAQIGVVGRCATPKQQAGGEGKLALQPVHCVRRAASRDSRVAAKVNGQGRKPLEKARANGPTPSRMNPCWAGTLF